MKSISHHRFPNTGYIVAELSDEEFAPILNNVNSIKKNFSKTPTINNGLVGHIRHEYQLIESHEHVGNLALKLVGAYANIVPDHYKAHVPWVNFQKKTEFNPPHQHTGEYSYVIWVKIPYAIEDEISLTNSVPRDFNVTGCFNFHYATASGSFSSLSLPADRSWEKKMIIFPANITHSVSPFYSSNEYRISVAGNLEKLK